MNEAMDTSEAHWNTGLHATLRQASPIPLDAEIGCQPGELLALVGPSGSGKTTILRSIAGLYRPSSGRIVNNATTWFDAGTDLFVDVRKRGIGMVFQHYALLPHMSALDNVCLGLGHMEKDSRRRLGLELLERLHLGGLGERRPANLSGGEQQRVALARALARDPGVLLLDEPFSAVDQVTRRKLRLELSELSRELRLPIVLVTHDLDEAVMLADRMSVLHKGKTLQAGKPEDILLRPGDATVARLVDTRNLFEGDVTSAADGIVQISWAGYALTTACENTEAFQERVCWCISPGKVIMHRRDRQTPGEKENPVPTRVVEILKSANGLANVVLAVDNAKGARLHMDLPPHVLDRQRLALGDAVNVSLLGEAIHLMPWQALRQR